MRALAAAVLLASLHAAHAQPAPIRIEPGLVGVSAIRDARQGVDYESVSTITAVGVDGVRASSQWTVPDAAAPDKTQIRSATTFTRAEDLQGARRIVLWQLSADPETLPGTTHGRPSAELFDEVRNKGEAQVAVGAVSVRDGSVLGGMLAGRKYFRGALKRVGIEPVRVLVDGAPMVLPALHVKGTLSVGDDRAEAEFWWLDDRQAPLLLKLAFQGSVAQTVRIDRPRKKVFIAAEGAAVKIADKNHTADAGGESLTQELAGKSCRAEVPGIYFLTNSAQLLPESQPAVERIASMLKAKSEWVVTIEGHTDNTGSETFNLDLSRRRAEALRSELVARQGIVADRLRTAGFGAKRPVDTNDTLDGRAHNRRVEVSRPC